MFAYDNKDKQQLNERICQEDMSEFCSHSALAEAASESRRQVYISIFALKAIFIDSYLGVLLTF